MSALLLSRRRKEMARKDKRMIKKAGCQKDDMVFGEETATFKVRIDGRNTVIAFSRDSLNVTVDGECIDCMAYITDKGYDVDLVFDVGDHEAHIYSDVEGTKMTNHLYVDRKLVDQQEVKDCISKHHP